MPRRLLRRERKKEGGRLKELRERLGWNMKEMAQEFMVTDGAISHWENGKRTIPGPVLKLIEIYEKTGKK